MGPLATLTLFPPHSLDTSILAAVLVGVLLLALLTESFGWVFVGLVVPGYLASIFVINPEAAVTVCGEALLTYLLARLISRGVSATGAWSEFFGRERFFLIVICSVLVRALSEVVLLPRLGALLDAEFGTSFMVERSLHSIGLVLVPLTANALWKLGLRRGVFQVGVPVLLTWAVLHLLLLPYTNLSFTSLELTYEDVAQRFLASPKAYIILLTTALLAARYNLRYGWDFNGILIAALVALTWLGPLKLVATMAEVLVLVAATRLLLSAPGIRTLNLEGPRKTVLVFVLGFLLKCAVGWLLGGRIPGLKVTDLFGFGYLIPTLLAVKILQKQVTARVLLPTLHTSLAGVIVGSLIGFPLSLMEPKEAVAETSADRIPVVSAGLDQTPLGVMAAARATCRESDTGGERLRRRRWELRGWSAMWVRLGEWIDTHDPHALHEARQMAQRLGLELRQLEAYPGRSAYSLQETGAPVGWGASVLFPGASGPVIEVPRPLSEAPSAEAAARLCERVACRAILVSGVDTVWAKISRGDPVRDDTTPLRRAHEVLVDYPRVIVRADASLDQREARLYVPDRVAGGLEGLWPGAARDGAPTADLEEYAVDGVTAVVRAHPDALRAVVIDGLEDEGPAVAFEDVVALSRSVPAQRRTLAELPTAELTVLDAQVARVLFEGQDPTRLGWVRTMAGLMGLELARVEGCGGPCWLLREVSVETPRVGSYLLLRPDGAPVVLEVPASREAGTLAMAVELFRASGARALLFTDPKLDPPPGSPHMASPGFVRTSFQALHQAAHRALPDDDGVIAQLRALSRRPGVGKDILVTLDGSLTEESLRPPALEALWREGAGLHWLQDQVRYYDGSAELAGLLTPSPQQSFVRVFGGAPQVTLWLSEALRGRYVPQRDLDEKLTAAGLGQVPPLPLDAREALLEGAGAPSRPPSRRLLRRFEALASSARRFVTQRGIHELRLLANARASGGVRTRVQVRDSARQGLPYLFIEAREGRTALRGLYFLNDSGSDVVSLLGADEDALGRALTRRAAVHLEAELEGAQR